MQWIDTHAHIYLDQFDEDRNEMLKRCEALAVNDIYLPNIDLDSLAKVEALEANFPSTVHSMIGLHPCDVKGNYIELLHAMENRLDDTKWAGIGETGIDLYWDKTFIEEQKHAFKIQIDWAQKLNLPIIIHCRDSFDEIFEVCEESFNSLSYGILHCFTGNLDQAHRAINLNLKLGIGGVLTFKNSGLKDVIDKIDMKHLVLETDSPFLAPTPYRGKRNEPSYIPIIGQHLANLKDITLKEVATITTFNAQQIFRKNGKE